jgi:hypothetical protein
LTIRINSQSHKRLSSAFVTSPGSRELELLHNRIALNSASRSPPSDCFIDPRDERERGRPTHLRRETGDVSRNNWWFG